MILPQHPALRRLVQALVTLAMVAAWVMAFLIAYKVGKDLAYGRSSSLQAGVDAAIALNGAVVITAVFFERTWLFGAAVITSFLAAPAHLLHEDATLFGSTVLAVLTALYGAYALLAFVAGIAASQRQAVVDGTPVADGPTGMDGAGTEATSQGPAFSGPTWHVERHPTAGDKA